MQEGKLKLLFARESCHQHECKACVKRGLAIFPDLVFLFRHVRDLESIKISSPIRLQCSTGQSENVTRSHHKLHPVWCVFRKTNIEINKTKKKVLSLINLSQCLIVLRNTVQTHSSQIATNRNQVVRTDLKRKRAGS